MLKRLVVGAAAAAFLAGVLYPAVSAALVPARPVDDLRQAQLGALGVPLTRPAPLDSRPARLLIPAIGVDAAIEARGLDSSHNLATPVNFRDVAWYDLGPRPGEPGNAILNGHVDWWTGDAVFTKLDRLRVGDTLEVARADGRIVTFTVTSKRTADADARIGALFAPSVERTLTLITCSGVWNPLTQSNTKRLLVSADVA